MKAFRFSLERVRQWRSTQLRMAEERLAQLQNELTQLVLAADRVAAAYKQSEARVMSSGDLNGAELQSLSQFRERTNRLARDLQARKSACEGLIVEQRQRLLKARKDHLVLEKLKDRQFKNWSYLAERELESEVADNYLVNWPRQNQAATPADRRPSGPKPPSTAGVFERSEQERHPADDPQYRRPFRR